MSAVLYVPVGTTVNVIEGEPPVDQSVEVESLQDQVATLTTERDTALAALAPVTAERDALQARIDAALVEFDQPASENQDVRTKLLGG